MALLDDMRSEVAQILASQWKTRGGAAVPEAEDVQLGNHAVTLTGTVLYADIAESTALATGQAATFAAEVYKSYLRCCCRIIAQNGGVVTAFDGDRVMGVFIGDTKNTNAARSALTINYAVQQVINPAIKGQYPGNSYVLRQAVGIDTSPLFVARTGVRGSNDLVWVGRAANYAAKLCTVREDGYPSWITGDVFDALAAEMKASNGRPMWEERSWKVLASPRVYRSNWTSQPT